MMLALLGTADPSTLRTWFLRLSEGGHVVDDLQQRPWGAWDGQVIDRYGLHWLIGFEDDADPHGQTAAPRSRRSLACSRQLTTRLGSSQLIMAAPGAGAYCRYTS
jgi:hypothetical protein